MRCEEVDPVGLSRTLTGRQRRVAHNMGYWGGVQTPAGIGFTPQHRVHLIQVLLFAGHENKGQDLKKQPKKSFVD